MVHPESKAEILVSSLVVRSAELGDLEQIVKLYDQWQFEVEAGRAPRKDWEFSINQENIEGKIRGGEVYLGCDSNNGGPIAVAMLNFYLWNSEKEVFVRTSDGRETKTPSVFGYDQWVYLKNLMVNRDFRERGIGTGMVLTVEQLAVEVGFREIQLKTYVASGLQPFYKRLGYHYIDTTEYHGWPLIRMAKRLG